MMHLLYLQLGKEILQLGKGIKHPLRSYLPKAKPAGIDRVAMQAVSQSRHARKRAVIRQSTVNLRRVCKHLSEAPWLQENESRLVSDAHCSGGVAVLWKSRLAVQSLDVYNAAQAYSSDIIASRFVSVILRTKGVSFLLASVYGFNQPSKVPPSDENLELCARIAQFTFCTGMPAVIAGDFNMDCDQMQQTPLVSTFGHDKFAS